LNNKHNQTSKTKENPRHEKNYLSHQRSLFRDVFLTSVDSEVLTSICCYVSDVEDVGEL